MKEIYLIFSILCAFLFNMSISEAVETPARNITVSTTTFSNCLSAASTNVQLALNSIDVCFASSGSVNFIESLVKSGSNVSLVNDSITPGNNYYYGTNASGTKGFFTIPATGVTSVATSAPITGGTITTTGTIGITQAGASANGYLSSTDWNTFNGKGSGTATSVGLSSPNSTLTLGGTNPVTTSGTINADINLTNTNTWTGQQIFNTANVGINSAHPGQWLDVLGTVRSLNFVGPGTGLTGTANGLSIGGNAGTVTTVNGQVTNTSPITLSGLGTSGSPYNVGINTTGTWNGNSVTSTTAINALNLTPGNYVNGDICTYTSSGTVLNCNTSPSGGTNYWLLGQGNLGVGTANNVGIGTVDMSQAYLTVVGGSNTNEIINSIAVGTGNDSNTQLLTPLNNNVTDISQNAFTVTNNNVTFTQTGCPFAGTYCGSFNGSTAYLSTPDNAAINPLAGDFTHDANINMTSLPTPGNVFVIEDKTDNIQNNGYEWLIQNTAGTYQENFSAYNGSSTVFTTGNVTITPSANTNYFTAMIRHGNQWNLVWGPSGGSISSINQQTVSATIGTAAVALQIGAWTHVSQYFTGLMSNYRQSNIARWTSFPFTAPTVPYGSASATASLNFQASGTQTGFIQTNGSISNALQLGQGSTTAITIPSSENVGIGTTNPQGGLVVMNGNVGIGTWRPNSNLNVIGNVGIGTQSISQQPVMGRLIVQDAGDVSNQIWTGVGIGTSQPFSILHVMSDPTAGGGYVPTPDGPSTFTIENSFNESGQDQLSLVSDGTGSASWVFNGTLELDFTDTTHITGVMSNYIYGGQAFGGYSPIPALYTTSNYDGNPFTPNLVLGILTDVTNPDNNNPMVVITQQSGGAPGNVGIGTSLLPIAPLDVQVNTDFEQNVGIGTSMPQTPLQVGVGNDPDIGYDALYVTDNINDGDVAIYQNENSNGYSDNVFYDNTGASKLYLGYGNSTSAPFTGISYINPINNDFEIIGGTIGDTPLVTVKVSGNVGIGTTTPVGGLAVMNGNVGIGTWIPGQALDVQGTIRGISGGTCTTLYRCQGGVDAGVIQTSACVLCPASTCVAMNGCF